VGLSPEEFWNLTWYDWVMYMYRFYKENERRLSDQELVVSLNGDLMALIANVNRDDKKRPTPFSKHDFYKFSEDTQLKEEYDPELFEKVARRLGSKIKGK
jgi:hypothetical protein